jgi:hypothetical protein
MQQFAFLKWFLAGVFAAVAVGWLAARIHASGHAPVGVVSLAVGIVLGVVLIRLAAMLCIAGTNRLLLSAGFIAIVAVLSEHAWLYHDFRGQWGESRVKSAAVAMFRAESPPTPREYFEHEWQPVLWLTDAGLIVAATVGAVYFVRWRSH